jgi:hypothetical protein
MKGRWWIVWADEFGKILPTPRRFAGDKALEGSPGFRHEDVMGVRPGLATVRLCRSPITVGLKRRA